MDAVKNANGTVIGIAIIADRSMQPIHFNVPSISLVKITLENYEENECPLCKDNVPLKVT
jgi:orotate phosphoribosyltransferase